MASTVFGTTELLEQILLELPIRDVLVAQRVSKGFHSIIHGSAKLQQALFFTPLPGKPLSFETVGHATEWLESPDDQKYHTVLANPIWCQFRVASEKRFSLFSRQRAAAFDRSEASWRRMLISQPPITTTPHRVRTSGTPTGPELSPLRFSGSICVSYSIVKHDTARNAGDAIHGLTLGDIDRVVTSDCRHSSAFKKTVNVKGGKLWEQMEFAREVRKITEPKPEWLLRQQKELPEPESEDDDDYGWDPDWNPW